MSPGACTWGVLKAVITPAWVLPTSSPSSPWIQSSISSGLAAPRHLVNLLCGLVVSKGLLLSAVLWPLGRWVGLAWAQRAGAERDGDGPAGKGGKGARRQAQR